MKHLLILFFSATVFFMTSQNIRNIDTVGLQSTTDNIYNAKLFGDSLSSSFIIVIKKEVKPHLHVYHTEQVFVLEGNGTMTLAEKVFEIQKGDLIFIPKNTVHSVKVKPSHSLKILSIQAPYFDGKDRVFIEGK